MNTKKGDIFSVKLNDTEKKYFQYITNDLTQLNSDVIRGFKKTYAIDENPDLTEIVNDDVEFYAHCVTNLGMKMGLWEKVENSQEVGDLRNILFRSAADYARKADEEPVKISEKWYIWKLNDKDFTFVGKLTGEYKKANIGLVVNPNDIVNQIKYGKYLFEYPNFE